MNEKLQQAISAARNGQSTEAQLLLTEVLKENPDETQAWFLLSTLVDSEQKKIAYLGKVLALDPGHQMAQKMLGRLQGAAEVEAEIAAGETEAVEVAGMADEEGAAVSEAITVSQSAADFLAQEKGDTLPEWLVEEEGLEIVESLEPVHSGGDEAVGDLEIPDWLQEGVSEGWSEESPAEETAAMVESPPETEKRSSTKPTPKPKPTVGEDQNKQQRFLTGLLYALVAVTAVIFIILIYLAWNTFF